MKFRKIGKKVSPAEVALVLSGGGAKGSYQVGVIKELLNRGTKIDLVIGSSIGAFNGALLTEFINSGLSYRQICANLEEIWMEVNSFLTFNFGGLLKNILRPLKIPSVFSNIGIKKLLNKYIPEERRFHHYTRCQLSVTGTNLDRKDLKIFDFNSEIPVNQAVLASMTFPVAFPAVEIAGDHYIDGGALDNAPLKEAILWGARQIYVVFLTPIALIEGKEEERDRCKDFSALGVIEEFIDLASNRLMYDDLKKAKKINQLLRILNRYEHGLPAEFLSEIRKLYGLKFGDGKKIIRVINLGPTQVLDPPGLMGFNRKKLLKELVIRGQRDARSLLQKK